MLAGLIASLGGKLLDGIFGTVDELVEDKDLANKLKQVLKERVLDLLKTEIEAAASIIRAEINSDSYLAKNWRPITMLVFVTIIANNYIIYPYLSLFFEQAPMLEIPPDMWGLLKIGLGGYVVGRSVEKGIQVWKDKG